MHLLCPILLDPDPSPKRQSFLFGLRKQNQVCDLQKDLTTEGFKEVVAAYSRDDGMVCYALFVKDIDAIFGESTYLGH